MSSVRQFAVAALVVAATASADVSSQMLRGAAPTATNLTAVAAQCGSCGSEAEQCFWDTRCSNQRSDPFGGAGCKADGVHMNCRFCDTGNNVPHCPAPQPQCGPCGSPSERCFWDKRCSNQGGDPFGGTGCKADGEHMNCRFCDTGNNVPQCPTLAQPPALGSGTSRECGGEWGGNNNNWGTNNLGDTPDKTDVTSSDCKDACQSASFDCKGWTWLGSCNGGNGCCYLKLSVEDMSPDSAAGTEVKSGYCYQKCGDEHSGENNHGQNFGKAYHVDNREFCKKDCEKSPTCRGWTVVNNGDCYLKSHVDDFEPDSGVQASGNC